MAHDYAAAGDYVVRLTVTDDRGGVDSVSKTVTVVAPSLVPGVDNTGVPSGVTPPVWSVGEPAVCR